MESTSTWNVIFRTGHEFLAGTDANIYLQITDKKFQQSPIVKFDGNKEGIFEAKSKDKFTFELPKKFKNISKIAIWHDGQGKACGWKLETIGIQHEDNERVFFQIQEVLDQNQIIERPFNMEDKLIEYDITVKGSDTKLKVSQHSSLVLTLISANVEYYRRSWLNPFPENKSIFN